MAKALEDAISALEYKEANYEKLDSAVEKAKSLDKSLYKDFSEVEKALSEIREGLDITHQSEVDAMTKALEDAINALEYKEANYDELDKIIEKAKSLDKSLYEDFSEVEKALSEIREGLDITHQSEVDAMVHAIEDAINGLERIEITTSEEEKTEKPSKEDNKKPVVNTNTIEKDKNGNKVETGDQNEILPLVVTGLISALGVLTLKKRTRKQ